MKNFRRSPADLVLMIMIATLVLIGQPPGFADQVTIKADRDAHNNPWALGNPNDPATNIWTLVDWTYVEPGGWGDFRVGFWHYNCSTLPANVTSFVASLYCLPRGDSSTNMEMDFWIPNVPWSETTCFPKTGPTGYNLGRIAATPTPNKWFSIELASVYNHPTYGPLLRANGFMLVPRSINNNFNVFASSEYATTSYRPKAVVKWGFKLAFPFKNGWTADTAPITAAFDHSMASPNCPDNTVVMWTGETGKQTYGISPWSSIATGSSCAGATLYGFKNSGGTMFSLNNQYYKHSPTSPDRFFAFYDGHTGIDYPASIGTPIYATGSGVIKLLYDTYNTVILIHDGNGMGYESYFLHMKTPNTVADGQQVSAGTLIGYVGWTGLGKSSDAHLHLTIKKNGVRVDPYGWTGSGTDPYKTLTGTTNSRLW